MKASKQKTGTRLTLTHKVQGAGYQVWQAARGRTGWHTWSGIMSYWLANDAMQNMIDNALVVRKG